MKFRRAQIRVRARALVVILVGVVVLIATGCVTDLGGLPGGDAAVANDISDNGLVVGTSFYVTDTPHSRAFYKSGDGAPVDIGALSGGSAAASAVTSTALIVGTATVTASPTETRAHAFRWHPWTGMIDLGGPTGYLDSFGSDVTDDGIVVGLATFPDVNGVPTAAKGWVRSTAGTFTILAGLAGPASGSVAYAINASGVVVGRGVDAQGIERAVRWAPPSYAPVALGPAGQASTAYDINANGAIVGELEAAPSSAPGSGAVRWAPGATTPTNLGTPPGAGEYERALHINAVGIAVGDTTFDGGRGVQWDAAGTRTELGQFGAGDSAAAINATGVIVGSGTDTTGRARAVQFSP